MQRDTGSISHFKIDKNEHNSTNICAHTQHMAIKDKHKHISVCFESNMYNFVHNRIIKNKIIKHS